ncbi:hypothetical protein B0H16DRAFT_839034 [Mycena metata]|uniref:Uncharacterized protein n=1 Tax=Mycena metata TaxID=1033252 RepID=A0AAD7IX06_9AGAR|nr:hypothetical protein B0H16DRAFT_839034 [Mycena metata]
MDVDESNDDRAPCTLTLKKEFYQHNPTYILLAHDVLRLIEPRQMLNDNIINLGLQFCQSDLSLRCPSMHNEFFFFDTFFHTKLRAAGNETVAKIFKKCPLNEKKFVFMPIHLMEAYVGILAYPDAPPVTFLAAFTGYSVCYTYIDRIWVGPSRDREPGVTSPSDWNGASGGSLSTKSCNSRSNSSSNGSRTTWSTVGFISCTLYSASSTTRWSSSLLSWTGIPTACGMRIRSQEPGKDSSAVSASSSTSSARK